MPYPQFCFLGVYFFSFCYYLGWRRVSGGQKALEYPEISIHGIKITYITVYLYTCCISLLVVVTLTA